MPATRSRATSSSASTRADGKVATDGWSKMTGHDVVDLAKKFEDYGVEAIIYTDIGRDGMLTGRQHRGDGRPRARAEGSGHRERGHQQPQATSRTSPAYESDGVCGAIAGRALLRGHARFQGRTEGREAK